MNKKTIGILTILMLSVILSSSIVSANFFTDWWGNLFNPDKNMVGKAYTTGGPSKAVIEKVTCQFSGSEKKQTCLGNGRYRCSGNTSCTVQITGRNNTAIVWKSSCGGYDTTVLDGTSEIADFYCSSQVTETVTCAFEGSNSEQECYSDKGKCKGYGSCNVSISGNKDESITWKSSCGGYALSVIDGNAEKIYFKCAPTTNQTTICTDSDGGKDYYKYGKSTGDYGSVGVKGFILGINKNCANSTHDPNLPYSIAEDCCYTNVANSTQLNEAFCDENGVLQTEGYMCPNGCQDGACVKSATQCTSNTDCPTNTTYYCTNTTTSCSSTISYNCINGTCQKVGGSGGCGPCTYGCDQTTGKCNTIPKNLCPVNNINYNVSGSPGYVQYDIALSKSLGNLAGPFCEDPNGNPVVGSGYFIAETNEYRVYHELYKKEQHAYLKVGANCWDANNNSYKCCTNNITLPIQNRDNITCTDSDSGRIYFVKGSIKNQYNQIYTDNCTNNTLKEWYCDQYGYGANEYYNCPNGCKDGACVQKTCPYTPYNDSNTHLMTVGNVIVVEGKNVKLVNVGTSAVVIEVDGITKTINYNITDKINGVSVKVLEICYVDEIGQRKAVIQIVTTPQCVVNSDCPINTTYYCSGNNSCTSSTSYACVGGTCQKSGGSEGCGPCSYGCNQTNGKCGSAPQNTCTDSDGGENTYVKGTIKYSNTLSATDRCILINGINYTDISSCTTNCGVREYSCKVTNGVLGAYESRLTCANGCYDSTCVKYKGVYTNYFLKIGELVNYNNKMVKLVNVGSNGAITVDVAGIQSTVNQGSTSAINGLNIKNAAHFYVDDALQRSATIEISMPQSVNACPTVTIDNATYRLDPCVMNLNLSDGSGNVYFYPKIVQTGQIRSYGFSVYGYGVGFPTYGILANTASGGAYGNQTLQIYLNDAYLNTNVTTTTYSGYLPIRVYHQSGGVGAQELKLNLTVKVTPKPTSSSLTGMVIRVLE